MLELLLWVPTTDRSRLYHTTRSELVRRSIVCVGHSFGILQYRGKSQLLLIHCEKVCGPGFHIPDTSDNYRYPRSCYNDSGVNGCE